MATNAEIWKAQQAAAAAREARKTLPGRLTSLSTLPEDLAARGLLLEAVDTLRWYEAELARVRRELNDEIREGQRGASAAYADGRHDGMEEARGGY